MISRVVCTLAVLSFCSAAVVTPETYGWVKTGTPSPSAPMPVQIAITRDTEFLDDEVQAVSHPASPRYTDYRSLVELAVSPAEAVTAVTTYFTDRDIAVRRVSPTTLSVDLTVAQVESIFSTSVYSLRNSLTGQTATRALTPETVPAAILPHVEAVFGVTGLPIPPRTQTRSRTSPATPGFTQVTPSVIASTYGVSGVTCSGSKTNRQAIAEFQGQLLSQKDLTTFFTKYLPNATAGDDQVYAYKGDNKQGEGDEANLDIQYIMGVAPGCLTEAWQYTTADFCAGMKQWTSEIISTTGGPNVHSVSYGWQGKMSGIGCSSAQISSIDADFATIAAAGISIIFASGDSGSGYTSFLGKDVELYSSWPSSSTYVTAVGATTFDTFTGGEMPSTQFGSGGGFSRLIPGPQWQSAANTSFYAAETKLPPASSYGVGGRGTPDVAALGEDFQVIIGGFPNSIGGTSASTPLFAGLVTLVNEAREQAGKKPLGLLNSWLYTTLDGSAFTDIAVGDDRINRSGFKVPDGFDAVKGWDPVSGFGTPIFSKFLAAGLALP